MKPSSDAGRILERDAEKSRQGHDFLANVRNIAHPPEDRKPEGDTSGLSTVSAEILHDEL